jgi:hypothetical protein
MNRFYKLALQALASVAILTLSATAVRAERYAAGWDPFFGAGDFPGLSFGGELPALRWTVDAEFDITGCSPNSSGFAVVRDGCTASVISATVNLFDRDGDIPTDSFTLAGRNVPSITTIFYSRGSPIGVSSGRQPLAVQALQPQYSWSLEFLYDSNLEYYGPRLSYSIQTEEGLLTVSNPVLADLNGLRLTFPKGVTGSNGERGFSATPIPEPGTLALLLAPLAVIGLKRRAKRAAPTA